MRASAPDIVPSPPPPVFPTDLPSSHTHHYDESGWWFDRVMVLPKHKTLICGIEKNGITIINKAALLASGIDPSNGKIFFHFSPESAGLTFPAFMDILQRDRTWRKVVVYRDPYAAEPQAFPHPERGSVRCCYCAPVARARPRGLCRSRAVSL
jgi:hypothetical protein